jgi:predicted DsbA family dithiol-disulfide isomerase
VTANVEFVTRELPRAAPAQGAGRRRARRDSLRRVSVRLVAYSDYLCPWCYNASVRLERLAADEPDVSVEWRSFLLRPRATGKRDLERFRAYTDSWQRPAAEADAGRFVRWQGDAGPPSHSVPAHLVAKAAAELGPEAFHRMHTRLLRAYFEESRDISDDATLRALWDELELPEEAFELRREPRLLERVHAEHDEALRFGANGVPSVRAANGDVAITGALPLESYKRWVARLRAESEGRAAS